MTFSLCVRESYTGEGDEKQNSGGEGDAS